MYLKERAKCSCSTEHSQDGLHNPHGRSNLEDTNNLPSNGNLKKKCQDITTYQPAQCAHLQPCNQNTGTFLLCLCVFLPLPLYWLLMYRVRHDAAGGKKSIFFWSVCVKDAVQQFDGICLRVFAQCSVYQWFSSSLTVTEYRHKNCSCILCSLCFCTCVPPVLSHPPSSEQCWFLSFLEYLQPQMDAFSSWN